MRYLAFVAFLLYAFAAHTAPEPAAPWDFKAEFRPYLIKAVPDILKSQDPATGQFGSGIWISTDQNVLFPLAVAWSLPGADNPYYHSPEVLKAIMDGGDALIRAQTPNGMWIFRKKDNSTWGDIYQPWTYSRWIRAYALIKDAMPADRRAKWEKALILGFTGISKTALDRVLNIPAHHAMGLYAAGKALDRPEWCAQATAFLHQVVAAQDPAGFWTEHVGPVVGYNFVYVDALGAYYGMSHDAAVLPALERATRFHATLTYPDGSSVETVDERNGYSGSIAMPNVGFSFSALGRGYIRRQWDLLRAKNRPLGEDGAAAYLLYGQEGPIEPIPAQMAKSRTVLGKGSAVTLRKGPWFACASAYTAPVIENRWIQDRQNFISLFHDRTGLIIGGGNTKLQPLWSTFTVGDVSLLKHKPGDEDPTFTPPAGLIHTPRAATLTGKDAGLRLIYGPTTCRVNVEPVDDHTARITYSVDSLPEQAVAAHITFQPRMPRKWETASGKSGDLDATPLSLGPGEAGAWFAHAGWRVSVPPGATIAWPVVPHNQYVKDGSAKPAEGRIVMTIPFSPDTLTQTVTVEVP